MKTLNEYINEYNDKELLEHIKIELNYSTLILEKYGLFNGCQDIVSTIVNDIKTKYRNGDKNFTINYNARDFDNPFFSIMHINCIFKPEYTSGGEYVGKDDNIKEGFLKEVVIDLTYTNKEWASLSNTLTHELTHAYEDYNRCKKEGVKTLKDIESPTYINAASNLSSWRDNIKDIKKFISFYIYLSNKSELNAFIAGFSSDINKLNITFDLTTQDVVKEAYNIIKSTSCYKKYKELDEMISHLDSIDKKKVENVYNDITNSNKNFNQIKKEVTSNWRKIMNKLNSTIPKIICDYIDKHTKSKKVEKLISKKL